MKKILFGFLGMGKGMGTGKEMNYARGSIISSLDMYRKSQYCKLVT